ncbi:N-acetyltransferase family protein [Clostridium thermobutyricum]|uniref:Putative acetyltransferase n=1 Tax=Clostridium thermobutyricum DSM 4928 TaxID=1121339 RepID=A0A1V4SW21_9CLOT|nr:GNAT family N-acetyltransferase [Clostridium thermobutyricum]OPX48388.1 putative acetyltransferase [Clostridium thermobutyricum DSM 4928]
MNYREIHIEDIKELVEIYIEAFNAPPWNDKWTIETASKRLSQMIKSEGFYGIIAEESNIIYGLILGHEEQFYDGVLFNIKEFCVRSKLKGQGLGSKIFNEFEKRLYNKGINEIILFTCKSNETLEFYKKRGLKEYKNLVIMGKNL